MGSVCSSQPPEMCWFSLQRSARGLFAEVSPCHFLLFSLQLHPGLLLAAVSSPVRSQLGELRGSDGVLPAFGVGEHPVLHPGLPAHRHLQCHDPEGQCWGENLCRERFWGWIGGIGVLWKHRCCRRRLDQCLQLQMQQTTRLLLLNIPGDSSCVS